MVVMLLIHQLFAFFSTDDWDRTSTSLRTTDFESVASTNSATSAQILYLNYKLLVYFQFNFIRNKINLN